MAQPTFRPAEGFRDMGRNDDGTWSWRFAAPAESADSVQVRVSSRPLQRIKIDPPGDPKFVRSVNVEDPLAATRTHDGQYWSYWCFIPSTPITFNVVANPGGALLKQAEVRARHG